MIARRSCCLASGMVLVLGGCAAPAQLPHAAPGEWNGRLSVRIDSEGVQPFFAAFELRGTAQTGNLTLFSPLGATLARLSWSPGEARLVAQGSERSFDSLAALTRNATGTELPVAALFRWLEGDAADEPGWEAELGQLARGKLRAVRSSPAPSVELRVVLD